MKKEFIMILAFFSIVGIKAQNDSVFVSVSSPKLNVLYIGIDNPISIGITNLCNQAIDVKIDHGTIKYKGKGEYVVRVDSVGNATISIVSVKNNQAYCLCSKQFRVKRIPIPIAKVGGIHQGRVSKTWLYVQFGLKAEFENMIADLSCKIISFSVSTNKNSNPVLSESNQFTDKQIEMIRKSNVGDKVYIKDIKAIDYNGTTRNLADCEFHLVRK
jgi:hypothetical protein